MSGHAGTLTFQGPKVGVIRSRIACALCTSVNLDNVMELPATPPANEFVRFKQNQDCFPLNLQLCKECGHVQLADVVDPGRLFENYVYVSGTSEVFVRHFEEYAHDVVNSLNLNEHSHIVDLGSNDGTLLKAFARLGIKKVTGVDPARDIALKATAEGISTRIGFFDRGMAASIRSIEGPATLVTANNVFAHADDLEEIALAARLLLAPEGEFIMEVSYLLDVVENTLFDTIYHEHLSYHSVKPLIPFLAKCGLNVYDVKRVNTHGGSIRICASRARKEVSQDLIKILADEAKAGLQQRQVFEQLHRQIVIKGEVLRSKIQIWKADGRRICGFGAPAKLTTLMHSFHLSGADIDFIIDDSELKQGLLTPGTNIPVLPSSALYEREASVCIVFAWNFFDSIIQKHKHWSDSGGIFINPLA